MSMRRRPTGIVVISILLMAGGVVGVLTVFWLQIAVLRQSGPRLSWTGAIMGIFACMYGFSVWTGLALFRNKRSALLWAQVLTAVQIPIVVLPGVSYRFHEGILGAIEVIRAGSTRINFDVQLGSYFSFRIFTNPEPVIVGLNIAALIALLYLRRVRLRATENVQLQQQDGHSAQQANV